jgi:flavin reductase (DIM6/NTAB) family NADH-FMN oxidoreductase RutF
VITADAGHGPAALTATSVISVSLAPPLLVFSLSAMSSSTATLRAAKTAVVHLLTVDELELAKLCATSGVDRFADCSTWSRLPTGEPFFHSAPVWIRGKVVGEMVAGDSAVIALEALDVGLPPADKPVPEPLVYHNRTWHRLGSYSTLPS